MPLSAPSWSPSGVCRSNWYWNCFQRILRSAVSYWVGVICSLFTTMVFLASLHYSTRFLEGVVAIFVGIMAIALYVEMDFVGSMGRN